MDNFDKIVLITGASSGIAKASAIELAKIGAKLILVARRQDRLEDLAKQLKQDFNTDSLQLPIDIQDQKAIDKAISSLPERWQNIDVLINNAGLALSKDKFQDIKSDDWNTMLATNIAGVISITQKVLPAMLQKNTGHIVNIGSIAGNEVYPGGFQSTAPLNMLSRPFQRA